MLRLRIFFIVCFALLAACAKRPEVQALDGETMGTTWSVRFIAEDADLVVLRNGIQQRLDRIVAQMSPWEVDSDISRYNRATTGTWQTIPEEFHKVLRYALTLAQDSGGAYDPTVAPLVNLWGFGPDGERRAAPSDADIAVARERTGWQKISLDSAQRRVLQPGGISLDFSSIAPGFALDELARYLEAEGVNDYLIETGGELRARGQRGDGMPWQVAVERPLENDSADGSVAAQHIIGLDTRALGSSGDYRNFFIDNGKRYSHRIDPRTGYPVSNNVASVTVLSVDGLSADPLATALSVMGVDEGLAFAQEKNIGALFIVRTETGFKEYMSPQFAAVIKR